MIGREDVNSILNTCCLIYCSLLGDFCAENIIKKKRNGQVLNKPQMRLLLKIPGGTFLQIQTDIHFMCCLAFCTHDKVK